MSKPVDSEWRNSSFSALVDLKAAPDTPSFLSPRHLLRESFKGRRRRKEGIKTFFDRQGFSATTVLKYKCVGNSPEKTLSPANRRIVKRRRSRAKRAPFHLSKVRQTLFIVFLLLFRCTTVVCYEIIRRPSLSESLTES